MGRLNYVPSINAHMLLSNKEKRACILPPSHRIYAILFAGNFIAGSFILYRVVLMARIFLVCFTFYRLLLMRRIFVCFILMRIFLVCFVLYTVSEHILVGFIL